MLRPMVRHAPTTNPFTPDGPQSRVTRVLDRPVRRGRGARAALVMTLLMSAALPATAAHAAKVPVYSDPPGTVGPARAPVVAAPPTPPAIPLSASGTFPDVLVDDAGTAHIVWNEGRGDDADVAVYCRLKRGASTCDGPAVQLTWNKTYGAGDGPQLNIDNGGPKIVRVGDQLIVLSQRYPTNSDKPDGSGSSNTVVGWVSSDGGQTWSDAAILGRYVLGQLGVIGHGDQVSVLNVAQDPLCPGMCVENYRSGEFSSAAGNLATGPDQAYFATLAVTDGIPTAAWGNLTHQITMRRWTGAGEPTDPGTWTQSPPIAGDEPSLAAGPAGLQLLSLAPTAKPGRHNPWIVRPVTDAGGVLGVGPSTTISTDDDVAYGRLAQDARGHVVAAWSQRDGASPGVKLRTTDGIAPAAAPPAGVRAAARASAGTRATLRAVPKPKLPKLPVPAAGSDNTFAGAFGPAQTLITGKDNGQIAVAATADGGGFAVLNHTGGVNSAGQIVATAFGAPAATGLPGLGKLPGGAATGKLCDTVDFGSFDIKSASGACLYHGTGKDSKVVSTRAEVDLYGLKIVPDVGSTLLIDPTGLKLNTIGQVKVLVRSSLTGDVVLWHGALNVDLSAVRPGQRLFDFPIGEFKPEILGFDVGANIDVILQKDGVHIPMSLKLPKVFLGASASAEFVADRATGLHVDSLHLHVGPVPLGAIILDKFDLTYKGAQQLWQGEGKLTIAGFGSIDAGASFLMGDFNGGTISFTPQAPVPIGPFVYLLSAGGGFNLKPDLHIEITASIGGGVAVGGKSPVQVDGKATADFPANGPGKFSVGGNVSLFSLKAGDGTFRFQTDGYADFNLNVQQDFAVFSITGHADGFIDGTTGQAGASIGGKVCIKFGIGCLLGVGLDAAVSSKGLAVCGSAEAGNSFPGVPPDQAKKLSASIGVQFSAQQLEDATETLLETGPILLPVVGAGILVAHTHIPCSTKDFYTPPPRMRAAGAGGGPAVQVAAGLPTETIRVTGTGGMPLVDLVGPGGTTVNGPAAGEPGRGSQAGTAIAIPDGNVVYFVLPQPKAGVWTVTPRDGSPAVAGVDVADGYKAAKATASVRTVRGKRSLAYKITDLGSGQQVTFSEAGSFGTRVLGTATTHAAGLLPVPASSLPAGPRTITAEVSRGGFVTSRSVVARYVAPRPPGPGPVSGLKVLRKGSTLTVTWRRASLGAARQLVRLKGAHGTSLLALVGPTVRAARFNRVRADELVTVEAVGMTKANVRGVVRRAVSRGVLPKKKVVAKKKAAVKKTAGRS
jgi:hypothetical protein